jgi:hypothetical protein
VNCKIVLAYLDYARELSTNIDRTNKHVSLVFYKTKLLAAGTNAYKTDPKSTKIGYLFGDRHSELAAYSKIRHKINGKRLCLVNYHFNSQGKVKLAKPCDKCMPWVIEIFDDIWYTDGNGAVLQLKKWKI